ncbi:MAG: NAD(P)H-binding protein [Microbacterium sp.]
MTGGSGWVGSALVPDLVAHGHEVTALARSETSAVRLRAAGALPVPGSLDDLGTLATAATTADAVVHLGFKHDIAFGGQYDRAARDDRTAIDVLADSLAGTRKALVVASGILGVLGLAPGVVAREEDGRAAHDQSGPISGGGDRAATARHVLTLAQRGIRTSVVRLPPATHGAGDNGFTATAVAAARAAGVAAYIGDGGNRWPAVHRDDAAAVFRLAVEQGAPGSVFHAVAEEGVAIRLVAQAIGAGLGLPVVSVDAADARAHLGFLAGFWGLDGPASAEATRAALGWTPAGPGWLDDLRAGSYRDQATR